MQDVDAAEPGGLHVGSREGIGGSPVRHERALRAADGLAAGRYDHADPARRQAPDPGGPDHDPIALERVDEDPADAVAAHRADELDTNAQPAEPARGIGGRATLPEHHPAGYVGAPAIGCDGLSTARHEHQVADGRRARRRRSRDAGGRRAEPLAGAGSSRQTSGPGAREVRRRDRRTRWASGSAGHPPRITVREGPLVGWPHPSPAAVRRPPARSSHRSPTP